MVELLDDLDGQNAISRAWTDLLVVARMRRMRCWGSRSRSRGEIDAREVVDELGPQEDLSVAPGAKHRALSLSSAAGSLRVP